MPDTLRHWEERRGAAEFLPQLSLVGQTDKQAQGPGSSQEGLLEEVTFKLGLEGKYMSKFLF